MSAGDMQSGRRPPGQGPVTISEYLRILWKAKWGIVLFSLLPGLAALGYTLSQPNVYRATAVIKPDVPDPNKGAGGIGALAYLGLPVGAPSKSEDLEVVLKSEDLTVRVFRKYDVWPLLFPGSFDPATGRRKPGWLGRLLDFGKKKEPLGYWDAIREAKSRLTVAPDRKTGVLAVSFETPAAEGSAKIVQYYLDEAKSRLQEEALARANNNKDFIQKQIAKTVDPVTRDRLYSLYGQEVEKEMLARNREQFGFTLVDSSKPPDRKFKPARARTAIAFSVAGGLFGCAFFLVRRREGNEGG
jgi:uncharacterized protein involved in exopolysaccharide biosynthesis